MSTDTSSRPSPGPAQLRTPVPPQRPRPAVRPRRGLGRPSTWALAVAALLVALVVVLLLTDPAPATRATPVSGLPAHTAATVPGPMAATT